MSKGVKLKPRRRAATKAAVGPGEVVAFRRRQPRAVQITVGDATVAACLARIDDILARLEAALARLGAA